MNLYMMATMCSYLLNALSYLLPICCFLPFRLKFQQKAVLYLIIFVNFLSIGFIFDIWGIVFLIITTCLYLSFIQREHLLPNICIVISIYPSVYIFYCFYTLAWDAWIYPLDHSFDPSLNLIYLISYFVSLTCICLGIRRLFSHVTRNLKTKIPMPLLSVVTVNWCNCVFLFVILFAFMETDEYGSMKRLLMTCSLLVCYFILNGILTANMIKKYMEKLDMEMRQESYDRLQEYTNQIENMYSTLRSFKHDYFNIMLSMSGYMEANDMEGLKAYFDSEILPLNKNITKDTAHLNQLMNIKPMELKSIISGKLLYAMEMNIHVSVEIEEEITDIPMDILDLSRITGIFLDNAIEAAMETETPSLSFAVVNLDTEYVFMISNSFLDKGIPFTAMANPDVSSKGKNRGLGLYNAHEIISQYDFVFLDTEIKNQTFIQRLHIPIDRTSLAKNSVV